MIHRFSVSNYHSIREEVVLDLRIPGTAPDLPRFRRSAAKPDVRLPTVAVLMGPSGSGKTTLLRALTTMAELATVASTSDKENPLTGVVAFASKKNWTKPIRFCLEIESDCWRQVRAGRCFATKSSWVEILPTFGAPSSGARCSPTFPRVDVAALSSVDGRASPSVSPMKSQMKLGWDPKTAV